MVTDALMLFVLLIVNAFFAASEIALISLNDTKVKLMAESGDKKSKMLYDLLSEPSHFLATIQIGLTLAGFLASAFASETFATRLVQYLSKFNLPISISLLKTLCVIIITIVLSYFTLVFGELVPKRLAMQKAERISMIAVTPLTVISKVSLPFVKFLTFSVNNVIRLLGVDPNAENNNITEEEIRMMVDVGEEKGTIQETEKVMINNIFEFDNKTVADIMTHRTNIVAIPVNLSLQETLQLVNLEKYTRFPVYETTIDNIIGILHVKDLIQFIADNTSKPFNLRDMLREPYVTLETTRIDELFKGMKTDNFYMAVVLDEYGGTDGIVTMEDLIEQIVGNISDEYDEPDLEEIEEIDPSTFITSGLTNLYEVNERLKINLPVEDYQTIGGYVLGILGYFPAECDTISIEQDNLTFELEIRGKKVTKVRITLHPEESVYYNQA